MSEYIKGQDLLYANVIRSIKKSNDPLRPIYEAIANSIESLKSADTTTKNITISLYYGNTAHVERSLMKVIVSDNGPGFTEENFDRFKRWADDRKGPSNKGSGRVQILHSFSLTKYTSTYIGANNKLETRSFSLSKSPSFLKENAIIKLDKYEGEELSEQITRIEMQDCLEEKDAAFYSNLSLDQLKQNLVSHFLLQFVITKNSLPHFELREYLKGTLRGEPQTITKDDIPDIDQEKDFSVPYKILSDKARITDSDKEAENFHLTCFRIDSEKCTENALKITSNGQLVGTVKAKLECLKPTESINGQRFIFLLSGPYLDKCDTDNRGEFKILSIEEYKDRYSDVPASSPPEILLEEIAINANSCIASAYNDIKKTEDELNQEVQKLRQMFLLSNKAVERLRVTRSDTDETILSKIYREEAKISAKYDASIKEAFDKLNALNPSAPEFEDDLGTITTELTDAIPAQNKVALSRYVARRQLILGLFEKTLQRKTIVQQQAKRNIDEEHLHNLLFRRGSKDAQSSDLWVLSEDYIYFDGNSESTILDLEVNGVKIMRSDLTQEEIDWCKSISGDKRKKKPDIFLYPDEDKCIIIELKNPNVNVGEHLSQINYYAGIIRNLTTDQFNITKFYGYLVGENFDLDDVRTFDADFIHSPKFNFVYHPSKRILGRFSRKGQDGEIYTEVIKYSELIQRARVRNKIFAKNLGFDDITELQEQ